MHLRPERSFVEPIFEDFLPKREIRWKSIIFLDIGRGIPPTKPLGLEMGIHMCRSHLLKFFDGHIRDEEGGEMTVNLPHRYEVRIEKSKKDISSMTCCK